MAIITLKFPAYCADETCGAYLPVGSKARIYRGGKIYGYGCHTKSESVQGEHSRYRESEQQKARVRKEMNAWNEAGAAVGDSQTKD